MQGRGPISLLLILILIIIVISNTMNIETRNFDKDAASWDENPARVKLAQDVAHAISNQIVLTPRMRVMDFGCGTGLLTLQMQPLVNAITAVDSSKGMLDMLRAKLAKLKLTNVSATLIDPDNYNTMAGCYDLVVSNMTLHHIREIKPLMAQFHKITASAGHLCITDLDLDEGQFHHDNTGVFHFGFSRPALRRTFAEAGFEDIQDTKAAEVVKPAKNGEMWRFIVFLMTGHKTK